MNPCWYFVPVKKNLGFMVTAFKVSLFLFHSLHSTLSSTLHSSTLKFDSIRLIFQMFIEFSCFEVIFKTTFSWFSSVTKENCQDSTIN
jgi:hypothetical protein